MEPFILTSLILTLAFVFATVARILKQPLIIAYIATGLFVGTYAHFLGDFSSNQTLSVFTQFGVSILLFIVGLNLSPKAIKDVGISSLLAGLTQVGLTLFLAYIFSKTLNFNAIESLIISLSVTFSSTIIVLKLLSDKGDLQKMYAKLSTGILLLQDVVASLILIFVPTLGNLESGVGDIFLLLAKGVLVAVVLVIVSMKVLPKMSEFFAQSQELLFLFSIAWGFGLASLFHKLGFSLEIGALVAGVCLSVSPYSIEISSRLRSLRDFFVIIFFIVMGAKVGFTDSALHIVPIILFALFVLVVKPLITTISLELLGYNKKTAFMSGISIAQISEFSLILVILTSRLGYVSESLLSFVIELWIITIAGSSYLIKYSEKIYPIFAPLLKRIERKHASKDNSVLDYSEIVLFGCNRVGWDFIKTFKHMGSSFLAVDFDPSIIKELSNSGVNCVYGDAEDAEFLSDIKIEKAKMIVSTIPDFEANMFLITELRKLNSESVIIAISYSVSEALELYNKGATYVIFPHFISGEHASKLAQRAIISPERFENERDQHIHYLTERQQLGHTHPDQE